MGMFSEVDAQVTAQQLEKIILDAINGSRWGDVRSAVKGFAIKHLIPWYLDECGETFGLVKPHPEIEALWDRVKIDS